ncbi:MAG: hypothetical protein MR460_16850, partial [Bilophila wadsworthia]|uniref:hypothetical protein n=1 Tax=Bilophila wadsworthia TaxID=35833 RepID=UPI00242EF0D4
GLGFELPLLTSFPDTSNGSGKEVFFIARKVKLCESPSKAGGLPILINQTPFPAQAFALGKSV